MNPLQIDQQLHDRATRGEILSEQERECLENWYMSQDSDEAKKILNLTGNTASSLVLRDTITYLQNQIDTTVMQLAATVTTVKTLTVQNKTLRNEVNQLKRELARCAYDHYT